jgi:hypothetical protein
MNKNRSKAKKITRWVNLVSWSVIGFGLIGYLPTVYFHNPVPSIVLAAMAVIPYAIKLGRPLRGAVVAGALGALAGISIVNSLPPTIAPPEVQLHFAMKYIGAVAGFCACVGALFGYMALQRHRQSEEEWKQRS